MNITEVKIKIVRSNDDKLLGYASITLDNQFVIRDLRLINGNNGIFVAMPSRKATAHCPHCNKKNNVPTKYCTECGVKLDLNYIPQTENKSIYTDIAHPISSQAREMVHNEVLKAYQKELELQASMSGFLRHTNNVA